MRKYYSSFLSILISFSILSSCKEKPQRTVHRSFYYWKSVFKLQPAEAKSLTSLHIENLYIKFFDVTWDDEKKKAEPAAQVHFAQVPSSAVSITPVVFITNETLQQLLPAQVDTLASDIIKLLTDLIVTQSIHISKEIQVDCDWTVGTKEKYFRLLTAIKKNDYCKGKVLSATIRLYQLKFISENGVPPVDKGLLMCYNMGNLRHPETSNSIIEPEELKKYTKQLSLYPLPLDVALPVFDWWVWFRNEHFKGLIHAEEMKSLSSVDKKLIFQNDTQINGYTFEKGDWLRHEDSPVKSVKEIASFLRSKLSTDSLHVILYHLDENNLSKYSTHELESFFDSFR
jgi:hypothetical protein